MRQLSTSLQLEIEKWMQKYPKGQQRSAALPVLLRVQKANSGYLDNDALQLVSDFMNVPIGFLQEITSFYSMYHDKKPGKYHFSICTNISCMIQGAYRLMEDAKEIMIKKLHLKDYHELISQGIFSISEVECLGACINAPVMQINYNRYEEWLTKDRIEAIIVSCIKGEYK